MKITYTHGKKGKEIVDTFNPSQKDMFLMKSYVLGSWLMDLYFGKDVNGDLTLSRSFKIKVPEKDGNIVMDETVKVKSKKVSKVGKNHNDDNPDKKQ